MSNTIAERNKPSPARLLMNQALCDGRTYDDLTRAASYFLEVRELWDQLGDRPARHAIYKAGVLTYARSFIHARGADGSRTEPYPTREARKAGCFDLEVHDHLLSLRNRFLAHTDKHAIRSELARAYFRFDFDTGLQSRGDVALATCTRTWDGLADGAYVLRILTHLQMFSDWLEATLKDRLRALQVILAADPDALGPTTEGPSTDSVRIEPGQIAEYPMSHIMGLTWRGPETDIGGPDYRYTTMTVYAVGAHMQTQGDVTFEVTTGPARIKMDE